MITEAAFLSCEATDDQQLARRFAAGEADAFQEVVTLYGPAMTQLARRMLAWRGDEDDVVQEAFIAACLKCHSFRGESSLKSWLAMIVINRCRSVERRRRSLPRQLAGWLLRRRPAVEEDRETGEVVRAAVARLPMPEREAVVLYYLSEMPAAEASAVLKISPAAFHTRLHRGRARLGELLKGLKEDVS